MELSFSRFVGSLKIIQKCVTQICIIKKSLAEQDNPCGIKDVDVAINYDIEEKDDTYQDLLADKELKEYKYLIRWATGKVTACNKIYTQSYILGNKGCILNDAALISHYMSNWRRP